MLAAEMSAPTWCTPVIDQFPPDVLPVGAERLPRAAAGHSRSSSRSSVASSSAFSFLSDESMSSCASLSSVSTASASTTASSAAAAAAAASKRSRTERLRPARVFVDTTKTEVTPYDGGKTTVLTGGVMLGAAPAKNSHAAASGRSKTRRF
ncbi:hypothetical protein EW145_g8372 [Phellinidium pouzarii]|uniref:Uncharacterized protein n=1 Tax=Phellinidium pouzarii TaxID=167371 RepID=A0A4S4K7P0_9AGAM|nr:hypothetical protein EW145_g8372 [Phellinidium pouzarii]